MALLPRLALNEISLILLFISCLRNNPESTKPAHHTIVKESFPFPHEVSFYCNEYVRWEQKISRKLREAFFCFIAFNDICFAHKTCSNTVNELHNKTNTRASAEFAVWTEFEAHLHPVFTIQSKFHSPACIIIFINFESPKANRRKK